MDTSGPPSQAAESELASQPGEESPAPKPPPIPAFPPYPPYAMPPAPPSVADTIIAGHEIRRKHKSVQRKPAHPPPRPARPRGPKATDVKLPKQALKAHARCLRCHGTVLTDRLDRISKPQRRKIIYLWREYAHMFPPETVARLRAMLDADEPFKPDQAYEYFINLKRGKKKNAATTRVNEIKKDILSMYGEKRFLWARNATVAFARGIQKRLAKSGRYSLGDGMLRLSNIILDEICGYMHMRTPSRRNNNPKAKFMVEMADKVAVWIDEILTESDDRMLMMDFDEDEDIVGPGGDASFADDFLDMMGFGGGAPKRNLLGPQPAYLKFKGPMLDAFNILTESMYNKGDEQLLSHGKFKQTYSEAADELKMTPDLGGADYNSELAADIIEKLTNVSKPNTPSHLESYMTDIVDICSKHLSQNAEYNKDKGPAFKLLVETMKKRPEDELFQKDKITKTYGQAARELEQAKGLETDHEDPDLAEEIHAKLKNLMEGVTPSDLKMDMADAMDLSSKYMSEKATDELERGPAFDILIKELERDGAETFYDSPALATHFAVAHTLKSAPGLTAMQPNPATAPIFTELLHDVVDSATPVPLEQDMNDVIERCANYLSGFDRDREIVTQKLLEMMRSKPQEVFASRPTYTMDYATGAEETANAPALLPYRPIKDIASEGRKNLTRDMEGRTPKELMVSMKALINDVSKHLSQPFALRSGIAGPRYHLEFLSAVKKSLGQRPLYKYKGYGQTYADAASTLKLSPLEATARPSAMDLHETIEIEMHKGVPVKLAPTIAQELHPTMGTAAKHLANVGTAKGDTLEHLVKMMKEKGEVHLAQLQGYEQSYDDGARRLEFADSLKRSQVELGAYETVKKKLDKMTKDKPDLIPAKHAEHLPEVIEESSKYLSAPVPETHAEKREVLADLMGRAGTKIVAEEGSYKMTHKEGGQEIKKAKVGVTTAQDEQKKQDIQRKVEAVIPDKKMQMLLKDPVSEGAAHLADTVQGRGEALEIIKESLKKEKEKNLITLGEFKKTHEGGAEMLSEAPHFEVKEPASVVKEVIKKRMDTAVATHFEIKEPESVVKQPASVVKEPASVAKEPASAAKAPASATKEPASAAKEPASAAKEPASAAKEPASATKEPASAAKEPASAAKEPASAAKEPASAAKEPASVVKEPASVAKESASVAKEPASVAKEPASVAKEPASVVREPASVVKEVVKKPGDAAVAAVPVPAPAHIKKKHMDEAKEIASKYIAGLATEQSGVDPKTLRNMDMAAFEEAEKRLRPETEEERKARLAREEAERLGKETEEERLARLAREREARLANETEEERLARLAREREAMLANETEEERLARLAREEAERLANETDEERKARLAREEAEKERLKREQAEKEQQAAMKILIKQLNSHGNETFYEKPHNILSYKDAADCLESPPAEVHENVKASPDLPRLQKNFAKKLNAVVAPATPPDMADAMQGAVTTGAQQLAEKFVETGLKTHAGVALISQMQKKGKEVLVEVDGKPETTFFAAQRLKKTKEIKSDQPRMEIAPHINKKMDEIMQHHVPPPKIFPTVKEHTKIAADFLSPHVTQPEEHIEAYVALLEEMEAAGVKPLIEGDIPKTHEEAAEYLRHLTSFEDKIKRPNEALKSDITRKLNDLMENVPPVGYTKPMMSEVIKESAGLLTSHAMSHGGKTEALKEMIKSMDEAGNKLLLRHGNVRKSYRDGADILRGKNTAQMSVEQHVDPVVAKKVENNLHNLMEFKTPPQHIAVMHGVIENATRYLAIHLLEPQIIRICKCMKNVFVQCELWCDEILRKVAYSPCTCIRRISAQDVSEAIPAPFLQICPGSSRVFHQDLEIAITPCPPKQQSTENLKCPAAKPTEGCNERPTTSYVLHTTVYDRNYVDEYPTRIPPPTSVHNSDLRKDSVPKTPCVPEDSRSSIVKSLIKDLHLQDVQFIEQPERDGSRYTLESLSDFAGDYRSRSKIRGRHSSPCRRDPSTVTNVFKREDEYLTPLSSTVDVEMSQTILSKTNKKNYSSSTSILTVSTDQMGDWHAMVVSLMWNVQAWRKWIQENIDRGTTYQYDPDSTPEQIKDSWTSFQRRVSIEAVQWRQYNIFSHELTLRLVSRYSNKVILSPSRVNVKTGIYDEIARDMMRIIDMFARWTQWLILVIKEAGLLQQTSGDSITLHARCWEHYKKNILDYLADWNKYNMYLNVYWEQKYQDFITDCAPGLSEPGPLWVVSACGAVPSGAIAAGVYDKEVIWIARTTHRCKVLPAALHPSKHCCLVYTDGAVFYYTKYQVLCNADVNWIPWRGGPVGARAIRVAEGVHIGRIYYRGSHLLGPVYAPDYRCHVVIHGQPFAFTCYDLLVLARSQPTEPPTMDLM